MKKKVLSFVLFFVFLFVLFNVSVNANEEAPAPDANEYDDGIVYITDNPNFESFVSEINYYEYSFEERCEIEYFNNDYYNSLYFVEYIQEKGLFYDIENKKVIVEFYYEFDLLSYSKNHDELVEFELFNRILCDFFSTLKGNGCEVLLICATDQDRYADQSDFLDYIDFHIDTDKFYYFMESVFAVLEDNGSDLFNDFKFFLSENISFDWFYYNYFLPYYFGHIDYSTLIQVYNNQLFNDNVSPKIYLRENNIYYHDNTYSEMRDLFDYDLHTYNFAFIGVGLNYNDALNYLDTIIRWKKANGYLIENNFYFNSNCYDLSEYGRPELLYSNNWQMDTPSLIEMVLSFVTNYGYTQYQNWYGRAFVTHKMLTVGPGWMLGSGRYSEKFNLDRIVRLYFC